MLKSRSGSEDSRLLPSESPEAAERQVVDLAQRAGKLDLDQEKVLAPDSAWRRYVRHLASMRESATARDRGRAEGRLAQVIAAAPAFDQEIVLRGERAAADAGAAEAEAARHDASADAVDAEIAALPRARRSNRLIVVEWLLGALAFLATDTVILDLSLLTAPGDATKHLITALGVAAGLLVYAHAAGWLWTATADRTRPAVIGLFAFVAALPAAAFVSLHFFRSGSLMQQAAVGGIPIADPVFFLPIQALLFCGAVIVSVRWFLAKDERRLLKARDRHRGEAASARSRAELARSAHERALRERAEAQQSVANARSELAALRSNAGSEDAVTREHGLHMAGLLDAEYLIAQEARRQQLAREERERQEREQARREAAEAAERARQEAAQAAERAKAEAEARAEEEHRRALELEDRKARRARERAERRERNALRPHAEIAVRSLLGGTTAALATLAAGVVVPVVAGAGVVAGLAVASGLLLRRSLILSRRAHAAPTPPVLGGIVIPAMNGHTNGNGHHADQETHA
jgi:hypothetical protein